MCRNGSLETIWTFCENPFPFCGLLAWYMEIAPLEPLSFLCEWDCHACALRGTGAISGDVFNEIN